MTGFPQPCPQQYFDEDQFHGNSSPATGASWSATVFMAPEHPQSAPSSNPRPLPGQPWGHAGVLQNNMFPSTNNAGNRQVDEDWDDMRPSVENPAPRDQLQDLQHHDHIIGDNARIVQDIPAQAHVTPPAAEIDTFNYEVPQATAGPAPAFLDGVPHDDPLPNGRASEVFRQLALLYLNDPNSQLTMVRMGPGHDNEVTVDITLKLTKL